MSVTDMSVTTVQQPTARARSRAQTRARLIESGRRLFADQGLHGVTSHDIARGAGVAAGTFYLHFSDKEELLREIVYDCINELRRRMVEAMETSADPREALTAHAEALFSFAEEHHDLVKIIFGRKHTDATLEAEVLDYLADVGSGMFRQRIKEGTLRETLDPDITSQAMTGMFARTVVWWIENPDRTTREELVRNLVEIQLHGTHLEKSKTNRR